MGLLENPVKHAWFNKTRTLHPKKQIAIAGSLFLARKILPVKPNPQQGVEHSLLMSSPAPPVPEGYTDQCRKILNDLFPVGWDRNYQKEVLNYAPTTNSCLERSQQEGGLRAFLASMGQDWYQDQCLGAGYSGDFPVKYSIVKTAGKQRGVTVASGYSALLAPLHRTIYNHISREKWLLRGEATRRKLASFTRKQGEVIVSGDYESATDNLSCEMSEFILEFILQRCRQVPMQIRQYALRSLRAEIHYNHGVVRQERGQLMGNFLSFPLLCIQNYLAFRFFVPRPDVPVLINGDDIVFRSTKSEFEVWAAGVGSCGLTLSRGKTLVHNSNFCINSHFFHSTKTKVSAVPVIRAKPVEGGIPSGGDFAKFIRYFKNDGRREVGALWLRRHASMIKATGRSIVLGLGIRADHSQICCSGLASREAFYRFEQPYRHMMIAEEPVPTLHRRAPPAVTKEWTKIPVSSILPGAPIEVWLRLFTEQCHEFAWRDPGPLRLDAEQEWWEQVKASGRENQFSDYKSRFTRLPKLFRGFRRGLRLRNVKVPFTERGEWVPIDLISRWTLERGRL